MTKRKKSKKKEYIVTERATQTIHRRNHAPLGRPPSDPTARKKYETAKKKKYARK